MKSLPVHVWKALPRKSVPVPILVRSPDPCNWDAVLPVPETLATATPVPAVRTDLSLEVPLTAVVV